MSVFECHECVLETPNPNPNPSPNTLMIPKHTLMIPKHTLMTPKHTLIEMINTLMVWKQFHINFDTDYTP